VVEILYYLRLQEDTLVHLLLIAENAQEK